jgi:flagellin
MQVINTNVGSLNAQRALSTTQEAQQTAMERLSSGTRINRAKDDAAGMSVADNMTAQIRGLNQAVRNTNDAVSYVQTAEGALDEVSEMMQRIRELAVQADSGTLNSVQQDYIDQEVDALGAEIGNVVANTEFNDKAVLQSGAITVHVGWEEGDTMSVGIANISASLALAIGFSGTAGVADTKALTLTNIDTALDKINEARSTLGAQQNRLEHNASNLQNVSENISASRSRILDTDFASESAELARTNVLQQAGMAMLSQANQSGRQSPRSLCRVRSLWRCMYPL